MYETEVYIKSVKENLPQEVWDGFLNISKRIERRSILHWTEHCTECSMPECFKTCDLYSARIDGKCQRFVNGIERIVQTHDSDTIQILKIQFKKWGVLSTQGNNELYDYKEIQQRESRDLKLAHAIHIAQPKIVRKKLSQKRYSVKKKRIINEQNTGTAIPDAFLLEIFNPSDGLIPIGLTIRNDDEKYSKIPFQYRIELKPGYNKEIIPFDEIAKRIKTELQYRIDITPEDINSETPLYFGVTEFVQLKDYKTADNKARKVKCVVWDLDNTIWDGILVEDGVENLELKKGIKEILMQIENKGIVNSIASKNNVDHAMAALKHFGIDDFFLFPKISWLPKSKSIREIALDLNININTFLFVDDSVFERKEVEAALPQVKVMDAIHYQTILNLEEFQIPITDESRKRKQFYATEANRTKYSDNYEGEYLEFLRACKIELEIKPLGKEHFERVYELTQRTNQMNFSGNRYAKEDIFKIQENINLEAYILKCRDQFGEYGIIGFGVIDKTENRLIDLMFSCRIQSKRVEHAFLNYILEHYLERGDFLVTYNHTEKNKFSAQVFNDFGFEVISQEENLRKLRFEKGKEILNDNIIKTIA
ncbi:MAG: HAD-IIIC family phosphatase [Reichenbachiella sp.]|uniref:HAD-IIIC family phosphatase n=1 Tax=Reichenbachiella sp. TaxID=2184521 RepID=UPI003265A140